MTRHSDLATAVTVVADPATLADSAATLVADAPTATPLTSSMVNTAVRTTVLPRVKIVDQQRFIVADGAERYELGHLLGEGGVGEVVKARDNDIDRHVAVKRLRPEMRGSQATVLRFAEEVRTVGRLEHPNVVPIHDVGVHANGEYFFVMKYVEGETLETIIEKLRAGEPSYHARYDFERRVEIMVGVLDALAYAHSKGIIHRDIKPANVMVGAYGEVVVMDWGVAREIRGSERTLVDDSGSTSPDANKLFHTHTGTLIGTPAYMSPEQARGETLDERSDVYSLCMTFFELLTLEHPYADAHTLEAMLHSAVQKSVPFAVTVASKVQPPVPADLSWFVERGLKKDKAARYQSVSEMLERLHRRAAGDIPVQCPVTLSMKATMLLRTALGRHPYLMSSLFLFGTLGVGALAAYGGFQLVH